MSQPTLQIDFVIIEHSPCYELQISGVTCGGKTTITNLLRDCLSDLANKNVLNDNITIKSVKMISQDDYFWPVDSPHHKLCEHLNHINWEILSALDMDRMCNDLKELIGHESNLYRRQSPDVAMDLNILIIEGFLIFNHPAIFDLCQIKFHLHLPYEECYRRRSNRRYEPPDIVGYFEGYVWPLYEKHFRKFSDSGEVIMLNGSMSVQKCFVFVLNCIRNSI